MKKKILVIEDDKEMARMLSLLLPEYEMSSVADGQQAVGAASDFQPDIILIDLVLPDAYGLEVAAQIQGQVAGLDDVPVIVISGFVHRSGDSPTLISGFPAFSKPVDVPALKRTIEQELARARQEP